MNPAPSKLMKSLDTKIIKLYLEIHLNYEHKKQVTAIKIMKMCDIYRM